jgi:glycosyltransferase involved in cell wall biosynthesis
VMARRLRLAPERIDVIPRGRDPERLGLRTEERRQRARRSLGVGPETHVILAAARQEHQKGLDLLLEAMPLVLEEVQDVRLVLAGREGHQTTDLKGIVGRLGLDGVVDFLGARNDVAELLSAADVFAFPSRFEGLGSVLIEAMALEAPIVTTDLPPVAEILHPARHALFVPPENARALAEGLVETLRDRGAAATRAHAARRRFLEQYTISAVADRTAEFYERALGEGSARRAHPRGSDPQREAPLA